MAEVLEPDGIGLVTEPEVNALADAIRSAVKDPTRIKAMGLKGYALTQRVMAGTGCPAHARGLAGPAR